MALDYTKAQTALDRAVDHFKLVLPYETLREARKRGAREIYEILPPMEFQQFFDLYWNSFFKLHHATVISTCPAFVTPEADPAKRKIYVKDDGNTRSHTLYHEVIDYLQHPNFYPRFY